MCCEWAAWRGVDGPRALAESGLKIATAPRQPRFLTTHRRAPRAGSVATVGGLPPRAGNIRTPSVSRTTLGTPPPHLQDGQQPGQGPHCHRGREEGALARRLPTGPRGRGEREPGFARATPRTAATLTAIPTPPHTDTQTVKKAAPKVSLGVAVGCVASPRGVGWRVSRWPLCSSSTPLKPCTPAHRRAGSSRNGHHHTQALGIRHGVGIVACPVAGCATRWRVGNVAPATLTHSHPHLSSPPPTPTPAPLRSTAARHTRQRPKPVADPPPQHTGARRGSLNSGGCGRTEPRRTHTPAGHARGRSSARETRGCASVTKPGGVTKHGGKKRRKHAGPVSNTHKSHHYHIQYPNAN